MSNAIFQMPRPENEPVFNYAPGSPEKAKLKAALEELKGKEVEIPLIINGPVSYTHLDVYKRQEKRRDPPRHLPAVNSGNTHESPG